ncbi:MAG: hypothetical protein LBQ79_10915 [Deltaproteobacteria bacterium]|nr:hypothetical protein [Deltaproteobacteria bacterium]
MTTGSDGSTAHGLSCGAPSYSGGLARAVRLGLPARIADRARGCLDNGLRSSLELLQRLDEARPELLSVRARARAGREDEAGQAAQERERLAREAARVSSRDKHRRIWSSGRSFRAAAPPTTGSGTR